MVKEQMEDVMELERAIKEMRRRTKSQDSLPSPKAAEKILYLRTKERNNKWGNRLTRDFEKAKPKLEEMFMDRYDPRTEEQSRIPIE